MIANTSRFPGNFTSLSCAFACSQKIFARRSCKMWLPCFLCFHANYCCENVCCPREFLTGAEVLAVVRFNCTVQFYCSIIPRGKFCNCPRNMRTIAFTVSILLQMSQVYCWSDAVYKEVIRLAWRSGISVYGSGGSSLLECSTPEPSVVIRGRVAELDFCIRNLSLLHAGRKWNSDITSSRNRLELNRYTKNLQLREMYSNMFTMAPARVIWASSLKENSRIPWLSIKYLNIPNTNLGSVKNTKK